MAKLIGSSPSLCLREIVRDKVSVDAIEFIIANTAYEDVAQMEAGLRRSMTPGPATDEMIEIAIKPWKSGRLYQATFRNAQSIHVRPIWAAAPAIHEKSGSALRKARSGQVVKK